MAGQPVWNPSDKDADVTLSNSNRTWQQNAGTVGSVRSTVGLNSGKWRVQLLHITSAGSANRHGFATAAHSVAVAPGNDAVSWAINGQGDSEYNGTRVDLGGNYANNGIVNLYIDIGAGKIWYGTSTGPFSGDPAAGTGAHHTFTGGTQIYLCDGMDGGGSTRGGTLQLLASYSGSPPSGYTDGWGAGSTTFNQSVAGALTGTASMRRSTSKRLSRTLSLTASIRKSVSKRLSAAIPMAATLARIALRPVALVAAMPMAVTIRRGVAKRLSATLTGTATMRREIGKRLSASVSMTATMTKGFVINLSAGLSATASMTRTTMKGLAASLGMTGTLAKIKASIVSMSASLGMTPAMTVGRFFQRSLTASLTLAGSMWRTISKGLSAALPTIARPLAWIAYQYAAIRNDKVNWNQCPRCARKVRPNKMHQQMEYRGPRQVWTGLYVCHSCLDEPQQQGVWPRKTGGDPRPVPLARPRRD